MEDFDAIFMKTCHLLEGDVVGSILYFRFLTFLTS